MNKSPTPIPVGVDLDGTLVHTDTLLEATIALVKKNPLTLARIPWWLRRGKAYAKQQIVSRAPITAVLLPYNQAVVAYLKSAQASGRELVLVTASDQAVAHQVAAHLGLFSEVIASNGQQNMSGTAKATALVARWGEKQFTYIGNAPIDMHIWPHTHSAVVVSSNTSLINQASRVTTVEKVISPSAGPRRWWRLLRSYQWVKNILLFVPLFAAHELTDTTVFMQALVAFISFCLASSSVYIMNDLLDLEADRRHPRKKFRPLTAGTISLKAALSLIPILLVASSTLATFLPVAFLWLLVLYLALTLLYSLYLKRQIVVDVLLLAFLYTIRIFAGAAATSIMVSSWLTAFALFFFLSLALVKRYTELRRLQQEERTHASGRGYAVTDARLIEQLGTASAYISALVLALYITSHEVSALYATPLILWLLVPLLLYWSSRVWLLANRGEMQEDPIIFAMRDTPSYLVGLLALIVIVAAA